METLPHAARRPNSRETWPDAIGPEPDAVFVLVPRGLGLGRDRLIGGTTGLAYRVIDLSQLDHPVTIHWSGTDCGTISDGADCIVFQGVAEVILPACMRRPEGAEIVALRTD